MKTIWKIGIAPDVLGYEVPCTAKFLTVQVQNGLPCAWFLCDVDAPKHLRKIAIYGTGHLVEDSTTSADYIGTFQLPELGLVFHVFDEGVIE